MLFADISGFTALTSRLVRLLGPRRGAEEVPRFLNQVYDALIAEVQARAGSVIGFAGDAITCWFAGDDGCVAAGCGLAMQRAMLAFAAVRLDAAGLEVAALTLKVSVTVGPVRRFVVGDPAVQLFDVVVGDTVARLEPLNRLASPGEVVIDELTAVRAARAAQAARASAGSAVRPGSGVIARSVALERGGSAFVLHADAHLGGDPRARATGARPAPAARPSVGIGSAYAQRPSLEAITLGGGDEEPHAPALDRLRPWLLPNVHRRLQAGRGEFLTELRPVAALFMSFEGIDYDRDPGAGDKLDALVRWVQAEAERVGGTVMQLTTGDKGSYLYLACGAPVSHEDDAYRCATAALHLREAPHAMRFVRSVSIGLGYGAVRTGAYGARSRRTYGALGEEVNLAARLMSIAPHGTVLASEALVRRARDAYDFEARAPVTLKGADAPVTPFVLVGRTRESSTTMTDGVGGPRLIGRDEELAVILAAHGDAAAGRGGVVQLTADAGIGKSYLIAAALAELDPRHVSVLSGSSQSFERTAPYRTWRAVFQSILGLDGQVSHGDRRAVITAALTALDPGLVPRLPLLSAVLDVPIEDNDLVASLGPDLRLASRLALLVAIVRLHAQRLAALDTTPVVVLEDLHWADPLSLELLAAVARVAPTLPLLVLTAGRPEEHGAAGGPPSIVPGATQLLLGPLRTHEAELLVWERLRLAGGSTAATPTDPATIDLVASLVERSEGNPFYLDELVTELALREAAANGGAAHDRVPAVGLGTASAIDLPVSLQSLILGRLDRLSDDQRVELKVASVIGRSFEAASLIACLDDVEEGAVIADLDATTTAQLTALESTLPRAYRFCHAITHEVAYDSLAFELRRSLHARVGRYLEATSEPGEPPLTALAFHYDRSDDDAKRREYLWLAARAAQAGYAHAAAIEYYRKLLPLESGERLLAVRLGIGEVLTFTGAHTEAEEHLRDALTLALQVGAAAGAATSQRLLGELHERTGDHAGAKAWLEDACATSRGLGDTPELLNTLLALGGNALWHLGEYDAATAMLREALELAQAAGDGKATARALHGLANIDLYRGEIDAAATHFQRSLAIRRRIGDELGVANSLNNLGIIAAHRGDAEQAEEQFRHSLAIRRRLGDVSGVAVVVNNLGYMAAERGDLEAARRLFDQSIDLRRELGDRLGMAVSLNNLADVSRREGDVAQARGLYRRSLGLAHESGNRREAATALVGLAAVELAPERSARLAAYGESLMSSLGAALDQDVRELLQEVLTRATTTLGEGELAAARSDADALTFEQMVHDALAD